MYAQLLVSVRLANVGTSVSSGAGAVVLLELGGRVMFGGGSAPWKRGSLLLLLQAFLFRFRLLLRYYFKGPDDLRTRLLIRILYNQFRLRRSDFQLGSRPHAESVPTLCYIPNTHG